ncbi:hypothetical protein DDE18_02125 [Nocardioides gansuensis]|uniref:Uncharacterized protein n=1 Tax=Nocardioides gansuensis TaxID=2138300 RepID=A0A2T8FFG3_9ACTN|nr:hypothetical protein [Nocardioides gansuensis]PVG84435.1 hypothetical protein DDE18_02125 [Nocardioides gansuensis]
MLPRLEIVRRLRPVDLVAGTPALDVDADGQSHPLPRPAPYAAAVLDVDSRRGSLAFRVPGWRLGGTWDGERVSLQVTHGHRTQELRSRRHGRTQGRPTRLGLALTGTHLTALVEEDGHWVARARVDLRDRLDTRDPALLAALQVEGEGGRLAAGGFGQLGLRDIRLVTTAGGEPLVEGSRVWLSATSAGPGFFDTGHTSIWRLDLEGLDPARPTEALEHAADLYFRRPDRPGVFGDHATHVVRDGDRWLVATSTWGDFTRTRGVRATIAETTADVLHGEHVLGTCELPLPTDGFTSVGVWDPHLVRRDDTWHVGYVSARKFFRFHPVVASGRTLSDLRLRSAATERVATEGTTLLEVDGELLVLASDGRDGRRGERERFPVFDLDLAPRGALDAPYPTNLPWPTLLRHDGRWWLVAFNGRPVCGPLPGYGTHGDVVVMREA